MSIKLTQEEKDQTYFCTFTCIDWIHLFELVELYDEIYKWFNILISKRHQVVAFVIMPNHLHALIHIAEGEESINTILANGKRFLAYEIIKRLEKEKREDILSILASHVTLEE